MSASSSDPKSKSRAARHGLTLIEFLVVLAVLAVLIAFLMPTTRRTHGAARRSQCKNNLKQIALALHNYADAYGALPPACTFDEHGERLHSWRTLILPFLEQRPLYETIDLAKPWNDPVNAAALATPVSAYRCPSAKMPPTATTYLGMVGEGLLFHPHRPRRLAEVTDGIGETAMVIEVDEDRAVPWMSPVDTDETFLIRLDPKLKLSHAPGTHVALADGSVRWISQETHQIESRRALATIAGGDQVVEQ